MTTSRADTTDSTASLKHDWLNALRYWLGGRKGMTIIAIVVVVMGAALNWNWLVAAGIAPLLLGVLPCAAMCALGLCMNRMTGGSCSSGNSDTAAPTSDARPQAITTETRLEPADADDIDRRHPSQTGD
ncbi:MAG: hypothetical protein R3F54_31410 [Alphaproteobacteria bacterium]